MPFEYRDFRVVLPTLLRCVRCISKAPGQLQASQQYSGGGEPLTLGYRGIKGLGPLRLL